MKCSSKPEDWITEDKLTLLRAWARDGMLNTEIIKKMDISESTLYLWKKKYPQIEEALRQGKEVVDIFVENALFRKAMGYNVQVEKKIKLKDIIYNDSGKKISEKERLESYLEDVHIPADTTAQIFWLKNRKPKQWRDKVIEDEAIDVEEMKRNILNIANLINNPIKTRTEDSIDE